MQIEIVLHVLFYTQEGNVIEKVLTIMMSS